MPRPRSLPPEATRTFRKQMDLFAFPTKPLPDERDLAVLFHNLNLHYFGGALPAALIRWSGRMRIAGTCDPRRRVITLSRAYHSHFPDDIEDTLKHEMIHLRNPNHDTAFRKEAERIGTSVHCREYPGLHPRARYVYQCPNCRTVFHRARRERLYCGRCARSRLDPRFLLVLQSDAKHRVAIERLAAREPSRRRPTRRRSRPTKAAAASHNLFS